MPTVGMEALLVGEAPPQCCPPLTQPPVHAEGFSDSDEVFPKEMTKWNSNDFIDAFASPSEAEGAAGREPSQDLVPPRMGSSDGVSARRGHTHGD